MAESLAGSAADADATGLRALSAVSNTLRIPLAARALGETLFPRLAVHDAHAARVLLKLGDDGSQWLKDRQSVYGVLARTRRFRELAQDFLRRRPGGLVVNLGCGLSDYFQWLDDGAARMVDADLPAVLALRRQLLAPYPERHELRELDLTAADWWEALGLPARPEGAPVFLMAEGVMMYLTKPQVEAVWRTFAERAPAGSVLAFDAMCWLAAGRAKQHPSVRHTDAQFHWGLRREVELTAVNPRLRHLASHKVMEAYGWPYSWVGPVFRRLFGVPFYALYVVGVEDAGKAPPSA
ncbi:class I SAM-dependent methyltransferase [Achromobacter xylosoxidans]|uniref:class I SAM-dependent methyltransferase n=1 Tax=Alcaligenes xylosoxydans xylosoxydans TaxID=85698 RepID=UPI001F134A11